MLAQTELQFATAQLKTLTPSEDTAVHQCRKAIKRLRALLRIVQTTPGINARIIDRQLGKVGRSLAPVRDASEVRRTIQKLTTSKPKLRSMKGLQKLLGAPVEVEFSTKKLLKELRKIRAELPQLFTCTGDLTIDNAAAAIQSTYAGAAADMTRFAHKRNALRAHTWRKSVQRLINQLHAFSIVFPEYQAVSTRALKQLANVLGEHNDLAVLRSQLKLMRRKLPKRTRNALRDAAKERQCELRNQALAIGRDGFAEQPKALRRALTQRGNAIALE